MRRINLIILSIVIISVCFNVALLDNKAFAQTASEQFRSGLFDTGDDAGYQVQYDSSQRALPMKVGKIIRIVLSFVGAIFLLLMIYAGYRYMMARGNEQENRKARDIMVEAIIGLVIVMSAYAITYFVGNIVDTREVHQEEDSGS